jgi:hypothetical protein
MHVLDENVPEPERELLRVWRIRVRQIGVEVAERGSAMKTFSLSCTKCAASRSSPATWITTAAIGVTRAIVWSAWT